MTPDIVARMVALRRYLHQHPELSEQEERTAARICEELDDLGVKYRSGVGGYGVVADIPGLEDGPRAALRADIDALPILEDTGLPFSSTNAGVMHACGHDGHTAILVGAAALFVADPPRYPVRLIFQPAEERGDGALHMVENGAIEGVDAIFAGHLDRHYPPGCLVVTDGAVSAASDYFSIEIEGRSGHGARPHETIDAVVVGSLLVTALQTIVSREIDPTHPAVISIGRFEAGTAGNVIAGTAVLEGTIRTVQPEVRDSLQAAITRIATAIGQLHGCDMNVDMRPGNPPVVNALKMTELARRAAREVAGDGGVMPMRTTNMGSEDFGRYLEYVPGCYIRYGSQVEGQEGFPAHSDKFYFDEAALAVGASWMSAVARIAAEELASAR